MSIRCMYVWAVGQITGVGKREKECGCVACLVSFIFFFFFKIDTLILFSKELKGKVFIMNYHSVQAPSDAIAKSMVKRWPKISCILF